MISRVTIFSLLLALMLGLGIFMHSQGERDRCNTYPAGGAPPKSEYVVTGEREVEVPCNDWFLRQPLAMQILCVVEGALCVIFAMRASFDLNGWLKWRHGRKQRSAPVE